MLFNVFNIFSRCLHCVERAVFLCIKRHCFTSTRVMYILIGGYDVNFVEHFYEIITLFRNQVPRSCFALCYVLRLRVELSARTVW